MTQPSLESESRYGPRNPERWGSWLPPEQRIRPALTWFLIGAVTAALLGWLALLLAGELLASEEERIATIRYESALGAYEAGIDEAFAVALEERVTLEIARYLSNQDIAGESTWAGGFRDGWAEGWNDALDAMRAASLEAGATSGSLEMTALDDVPRRSSSR